MSLRGPPDPRPLTPVFETCLGLDWNAGTKEIWFTATRAAHASSLLAVGRSGDPRIVQALPAVAVLEDVSAKGERCLLTLRDERTTLAVRRGREPPRDLTWLGLSLAADVSPDGRMVLFWDGGASEKSSGIWLRSLDGSDAIRLGDGEPKRFSPDGDSVVAVTRPASGATRFLLIPVGAGATRTVTPPGPDSTSPSFAGPGALLFVRRVGGRKQVWKMQTDGTGARALGADDCDDPMASPSGEWFLAICGEGATNLEVRSMIITEVGRTLLELPRGDRFYYARWNETGGRVFGITRQRRLLTLDASSGALIAEERLPTLGKGEGDLAAASMSPDGSVQVYSAPRSSSRLYIGEGIR